MEHALSGWLLVFAAAGAALTFFLIMIEEEFAERHMRLLSLIMGVPMTVLLVFEGFLSGWAAGVMIAGVVTFATRPWDRYM